MPKITDYPIIDAGEDTKVLGVNDEGEVVQVNANSIGEQWEDITDKFTEGTYSANLHNLNSNFGRNDVNAKGVFRVYLETLNEGANSSLAGNARVFMFTIDANSLNSDESVNFSTGTIYDYTQNVFTGNLSISSSESRGVEIRYYYEVAVDNRSPKVFKIERLVE